LFLLSAVVNGSLLAAGSFLTRWGLQMTQWRLQTITASASTVSTRSSPAALICHLSLGLLFLLMVKGRLIYSCPAAWRRRASTRSHAVAEGRPPSDAHGMGQILARAWREGRALFLVYVFREVFGELYYRAFAERFEWRRLPAVWVVINDFASDRRFPSAVVFRAYRRMKQPFAFGIDVRSKEQVLEMMLYTQRYNAKRLEGLLAAAQKRHDHREQLQQETAEIVVEGRTISVRVMNHSRRGLGIASRVALEKNQGIDLVVEGNAEIEGRIAWVKEEQATYMAGISFPSEIPPVFLSGRSGGARPES